MSEVYSGDPCERSDPKVYEPQIQLFGVFPMLSLDEKIFAGIMADSPAGLHASRPGKWSVVITVLVAIGVLTREVIRINVLPRADSVRIRVRERGSEDRSTDSPSWDRASSMHATDGRDVAHGRSMTSPTEPTATSAASPSAATPQAEALLLPTRALGQKSSAVTSTVECRDNRTIVRTGSWSRAGQRLGNTICMLGRALREAEDAGGGVLELLSPGSRFYNTTVFCVDPSAASAKVPRPTAVLEGTFSCYQPCKCGGGNFHRFRNPLQKYILPNFLVQPFEMSDNTVVIHVRSGDVMRTTGGVKYWQPPVKYYKYIIETFHPDADVVIATEEHGLADGTAGGNPIVQELMNWRPSIRMPPANFRADVATVLGARVLVQAVSSFSSTLAIMSPRLRRTYIPHLVSLRESDTKCCNCSRAGPEGGLPKEWKCGAENGWPQSDGGNVDVVKILLAGYVAGSQTDFGAKTKTMMEWDGPVCHLIYPPPS